MTTRIFIDGAAGTTGLEIRDRLEGREPFELLVLDETQRKDEAARKDALHEAEIAILCLPDDAAREAVELARGSNTRIIDASSAHRVAPGWVYGFPEIVGRQTIADARYVSNPGCYPTGFIALVAPLVRAGLLPADWPYCVNAVSGYSGGGKALIERFTNDAELGFRTYGLDLAHKHLPEMQVHTGLKHAPIFAPSVVRAFRGMVVDVPLNLGAMAGAVTAEQLDEELRAFFAGSKVVTVCDAPENGEIVLHENAAPDDAMQLYVLGDKSGRQARLIARLDNLGKGASGAAIQNLNILCGLDETAGLRV
jgi:N-acetyl-gamma-glutamyl-phosphate reductase